MSMKETDTTGTALATLGDDALTAQHISAFAQKGGFTEDTVLKVGNPETGGVAYYAGELIGPGPDIELNDDSGSMPTWQFHPLTVDKKTGTPTGVNRNAIHTIICSANLDAACKRAAALKQAKPDLPVSMAIAFQGVGKNRVGQPLNLFKVFNKVGPIG